MCLLRCSDLTLVDAGRGLTDLIGRLKFPVESDSTSNVAEP
jgi:hypothetical protein